MATDTSVVLLDGGRRLPRADMLIDNKKPGLFSRFSATHLGGMAVKAASDLIRAHLAGQAVIRPIDPAPLTVPDRLPVVDLGHHSLAIDAILVDVVRRGLTRPLDEGLRVEAAGFGACKRTVDMDIGMKNFIQNGPRVPALFLHE